MFTTPIITDRMGYLTGLNAGLKQSFLLAELIFFSTRKSIIGSLRSMPNLVEWMGAEITQLDKEVQHGVAQVIALTTNEQNYEGYLKVNAWANLLRKGNYNPLHNRPESAWPGIH